MILIVYRVLEAFSLNATLIFTLIIIIIIIGLGYQAVLGVKLESWILNLVVKPWVSNLGLGYQPVLDIKRS